MNMNVRADVDKPGETVTHKADNRNTQPEKKRQQTKWDIFVK